MRRISEGGWREAHLRPVESRVSVWAVEYMEARHLTEISKSTSLSVNVETELSKQKRYSPGKFAVKT